jgi:hypothetical protein
MAASFLRVTISRTHAERLFGQASKEERKKERRVFQGRSDYLTFGGKEGKKEEKKNIE